jgi:hypothetical protein
MQTNQTKTNQGYENHQSLQTPTILVIICWRTLLKVTVSCLAPHLLGCLGTDSSDKLNDPGRYLLIFWTVEGSVGFLAHQPAGIHFFHVGLVVLIEAHVDRLNETSAASRNILNLNAKFLDGVGNTPKEMNLKGIKE